jgi:thiamine-phosphate pyrophosphorylase
MIADAARAGVDMIQLRERDLPTRDLIALAASAAEAVAGTGARLFVNDRLDVALAAGAAGVHLTTRSIPPRAVRACVGDRLGIGVSTHGLGGVLEAEAGGADFVVCGPLFDTPSKRAFGPPMGPAAFAAVAAAASIPVLALGGVGRSNAAAAIRAGAAGVAAIRLFQEAWLHGGADALVGLVAELRRAGGPEAPTP